MKYLNDFYRLKCAGDVLNCTGPVNNGAKETTEAMSIVSCIRPLVLANKMEYTLVDLCAGNCLTGIISVHLLPVQKSIAVDIRKPKSSYFAAKRFEYVHQDIYKDMCWLQVSDRIILVSCHPCGGLANKTIELYKKYDNIEHLVIMPCCTGNVPNSFKLDSISKYDSWSMYLANKVDGRIFKDVHCISPCNNLVIASKG